MTGRAKTLAATAVAVAAIGATACGGAPSGCISIGDVPARPWGNVIYLARSNDPCPVGYMSRQACVVTDSWDPAHGTGGCGYHEKPATIP